MKSYASIFRPGSGWAAFFTIWALGEHLVMPVRQSLALACSAFALTIPKTK